MSGGIEFCFFAGAACLVRKEFPIGVKEQSPLTGFTTATMAKIIDSGLPVLRRSQSMLEYIILTALMVIIILLSISNSEDEAHGPNLFDHHNPALPGLDPGPIMHGPVWD